MDLEKLNTALRNHDVDDVVKAIGADGLADRDTAQQFLEAVRHSSCLAIQIENTESEKQRDQLILKCRELLGKCNDRSVLRQFEAHVSDAAIAEFGYREIFRSLHSSDIYACSEAEQGWGAILRARRELEHVHREVANELEKLGAQEHPSLDPRQLRIKGENGSEARPDAVIHWVVRAAGDTLITLAYKHRWFDRATGAIVMPNEVQVGDEVAFKAGNFFLAATQWTRLEHAWDRCRFFEAHFKRHQRLFPIKGGGTQSCEVLEVSHPKGLEQMDRVALHRLEQAFFQTQKDIDFSHADAPPQAQVQLPPNGSFSSEEKVSVDMLDGQYHLPIYDDTVLVGGIPFKALIRGYAYFARLAHQPGGEPIFDSLRFTEDELVNGFVSAGLSRDQARSFIQLTTFGRGVADLFDAPLLRVRDGSFRFFAPAYHSPVLGVVGLSRISSLNRRRDEQGEPANDNAFEEKGKLFEERIVQLFTDAGIPAHGFRYTLNGVHYDCDAAVILDDCLFIFECKNRSLPLGHLPSIHYFTLGLNNARQQVSRIARDLNAHPEIVRDHFGTAAKWNRVIPVVLNALPWSDRPRDGVYTYDASALSHFIKKGFTSIIAEYAIGPHRFLRRHRYQLRKGKTPSARELEREMKNPNQLALGALGWEQMARPVQVSSNVVFHFPEWSQRAVSLREQMTALGSSPEEAARVTAEMQRTIPDGLEKLRERYQTIP